MQPMYDQINEFIQKANRNHFGFGDIQITEQAQFTEYPKGGFYDWHMDLDVHGQHEPPIRKISMTYAREHLVAILYCHVIVNKPLKGQRKTAS